MDITCFYFRQILNFYSFELKKIMLTNNQKLEFRADIFAAGNLFPWHSFLGEKKNPLYIWELLPWISVPIFVAINTDFHEWKISWRQLARVQQNLILNIVLESTATLSSERWLFYYYVQQCFWYTPMSRIHSEGGSKVEVNLPDSPDLKVDEHST